MFIEDDINNDNDNKNNRMYLRLKVRYNYFKNKVSMNDSYIKFLKLFVKDSLNLLSPCYLVRYYYHRFISVPSIDTQYVMRITLLPRIELGLVTRHRRLMVT